MTAPAVVVVVLSALAAGLTATHVGYELTRLAVSNASDASDASPPSARWVTPAVAIAAVGFVLVVPRGALRDWRRFGLEYVIAWTVVAYLVDALATFCVAFVVAPVLVYPLAVAHARGVLHYDPTVPGYVLPRGALYAGVRSLGAAAVAAGWLAPRVALLMPVAITSVDTVGMVVYTFVAPRTGLANAYTFGVATPTFAVYAALKTSLFVALPVVEEALLRTVR